MSVILVGFDDTPGADDALMFAAAIARETGASLRLAWAYPGDHERSRIAAEPFRDYTREDAGSVLAGAAASVAGVDVDVATEVIADATPSQALYAAAERCGAALVVVGSTHRGRVGRVLPGSTGERLLHGSSCAVAIAPHGYATHEHRIATIGVGYDASEASAAALAAACLLARRFGAALRVIHAFDASHVGRPALMSGPAWASMRDEHGAAQREELERAVEALPDDVDGEARFVVGNPSEELARQSEDADVIVVGSRGHGPLAAVVLGGVTHGLLRAAACPVIVLPRGADAGSDALFTLDRSPLSVPG